MKKQCTRSSCRKFFTLPLKDGKCPYCGKTYARAGSFSKPERAPMTMVSVNGRLLAIDPVLIPHQDVCPPQPPRTSRRVLLTIKALRALIDASLGVHMSLADTKKLAENIVYGEQVPAHLQLDANGVLLAAGEPRDLPTATLLQLEKASGPVLSLNGWDIPMNPMLQELSRKPALQRRHAFAEELERFLSAALADGNRPDESPRLESVCAKLAADILGRGSFSRVIRTDDSGRIVHATPVRPCRLS